MKYSELIKENRRLGISFTSEPIKVLMLSNTVVDQAKEIIEYDLRKNGVYADVEIGGFNNFIQDSFTIDHHILIVFLEAWNLAPELHIESSNKPERFYFDLERNVQLQINTLLENASSLPLVIVNTFTADINNECYLQNSLYHQFVNRLNQFLSCCKNTNLKVIEKQLILTDLAYSSSFSPSYFNHYNIPYTKEFFERYSYYVKFLIFSVTGKTKKLIIMDADNTLWKGVVGEDGIENLKMDLASPEGRPFYEVQKMTKALINRGVIIGLCSKNNETEVLDVFKNRLDMVLKAHDFVIKKINWDSKVNNILEIAKELNIGLDSIVFWDDSAFEIEQVKQLLPEVLCFLVPEKPYDYPLVFKEHLGWFYSKNTLSEDTLKTKLYQMESERAKTKSAFSTTEEFLQSLDLEITIENPKSNIERIAQLTQKTNQFNLSTKRYSSNQINDLIENSNFIVVPFSLKDKFGEYGLTGLCILQITDELAILDTFLLSCRILGRKVEDAILNHLFLDLKNSGISKIEVPFVKSEKNSQVEQFLDKYYFRKESKNEKVLSYYCSLKMFNPTPINFINLKP